MIELTAANVARSGALLLADDGAPNNEYDRAIGELVTELLGFSMDFMPTMLAVMQASRAAQFDCCDEHPYCDLCGEGRVRWRLDEVGVCDDDLLAALIQREGVDAPFWEPTHVSILDGSTARVVSEWAIYHGIEREGMITLENEDGLQWNDRADLWEAWS